jgi:hypothetical protein
MLLPYFVLTIALSFDVLLIAGTKSKYLADTDVIHREVAFLTIVFLFVSPTIAFQMSPGLCSMIKIEEVAEPLNEAPIRVAEAVLLFCQVLHTIFTLMF